MNKADNKALSVVLILFFIVQPLLDIYLWYLDEVRNLTIISPATILRVLLIVGMMAWTIRLQGLSHFERVGLCVYLVLVILYGLLHLYVARSFPVALPDSFRYSMMDEANLLIRLMLPLMLIWVSHRQHIPDDWFDIAVPVLAGIISVSMIVTNLLHISLLSYSEQIVFNEKYTFFSWFSGLLKSNPYLFNEMATKGVFYKANQLSGVLALVMPLNVAVFLRKRTILHFLSVLLQIFAMFMVGSRTALYGCILSLVVIPAGYILLVLLKKEKMRWINIGACLLFATLFGIIYPFSPAALRPNVNYIPPSATQDTIKPSSDNSKEQLDLLQNNSVKREVVIKNVVDELNNLRIPTSFHVAIYPVSFDPDFWIMLKQSPLVKFNDSRKLERLITSHILEKAPQKWKYILVGMGRSLLMSGSIYIEQDYVAQFYSLGIIGFLLFIVPILAAMAWCCIMLLFRFSTHINLISLALTVGVGMLLLIAYQSGHILEEVFPMLLCAILLGQLIGRVEVRSDDKRHRSGI